MERDFKGVWIPKEIWLNKQMTLMEKVFFIEIDSLDNDIGCYASNQYFADFFGLSKNRSSEIIKNLEKKGFIEITYQYKKNTKLVEKRIIKVVEKSIKGYSENRQRYSGNCEDNNTIFNNTDIIITPSSKNHKHSSNEEYGDEVFSGQLDMSEYYNSIGYMDRDNTRYDNVDLYNNNIKADFPQNGKNGKVRLTSQLLQEIIQNWNDLGVGKVRDIRANTRRYKRIKGIIDDYGYDDLITVMNTINDSPFLKGENDRNWKITMDWFLEPNNYQKVRDGNYISHHNNYNNNTNNPEENENAIGSFLGQ